jgi:hypothetical protein
MNLMILIFVLENKEQTECQKNLIQEGLDIREHFPRQVKRVFIFGTSNKQVLDESYCINVHSRE